MKTKTPSKKERKSKIKKETPKQKKITGFFKSSDELNELLKTPPKEEDNDEDIEKEFNPNFAEKIQKMDELIEEEKKEEREFQEFRQENAKFRDRLELEITESVIKKMFSNNLTYLKVKSSNEL